MISVHFPGKTFSITVIQVYDSTSNAEEAEVERFYEDLQDLLEVTPRKDVLFIIGEWNTKVGNQEIPVVTGKFGLGVQNEVGQKLTVFCQENVVVMANTYKSLPTREDSTHGHHQMVNTKIRLIIFFSQRWRSSVQSAKTRQGPDWGSCHVMNSLLQNSNLN